MKGKQIETLGDIYAQQASADREDRLQAETILDALKRKEEKSKTRKEKIEDCKKLAATMAQPQNQRAAMVFVATSLAMFTLPIIALLVSTYFIVPLLDISPDDADMVSAGFAMCTAIGVIIAYVVYAFYEDSLSTRVDFPGGPPASKEARIVAAKKAAAAKEAKLKKD